MLVIKTLLNSWSTSDRYHEAHRLPCLFGCQTGQTGVPLTDETEPSALHAAFAHRPAIGDHLKHYLKCPNMWLIIATNRRSLPAIDTGERLGVVPVNRSRLLELAIAFHTYHAAKITHLNDIQESLANPDRTKLHKLLSSITRVANRVFEMSEP